MYFSDLFDRGQETETLERELNLGVGVGSRALRQAEPVFQENPESKQILC